VRNYPSSFDLEESSIESTSQINNDQIAFDLETVFPFRSESIRHVGSLGSGNYHAKREPEVVFLILGKYTNWFERLVSLVLKRRKTVKC